MQGTKNRSASAALMSLAGVALVLAACGGSPPSDGADASRGRELYTANCALCHGTEGEGRARLGKSLQASPFVDSLSDDELVEFLKQGRPASDPANERGIDMPPKGGNPSLTDEDLMEIVAYLRSL